MKQGEDQKKFLNALLLIPGVGYETIRKIREGFYLSPHPRDRISKTLDERHNASQGEKYRMPNPEGWGGSYEKAWNASPRELIASGIEQKTAETVERAKKTVNPDKEMLRLEKNGVTLIEESDSSFPEILKEIPSPPMWLYIKRNIDERETTLAVVGSRKATSYGKEAVEKIISGLSRKTSVTVASGLAVGIDGEAHRSALKHGLQTIAVVGSGLDEHSLFPPQHISLMREIVERGGTIISEYPLGMPAFKQNFIQRNRLIAGLSKGTLVVEAAEKSGALITARFALEQGRSVMAVPGSIFSPYSKGVNTLISEGARVITSADDVIDELCLETRADRAQDGARLTDEKEKIIFENLNMPLKVDELVEKLNLPPADIISRLSMLELKGLVKNMNGEWIRMA